MAKPLACSPDRLEKSGLAPLLPQNRAQPVQLLGRVFAGQREAEVAADRTARVADEAGINAGCQQLPIGSVDLPARKS